MDLWGVLIIMNLCNYGPLGYSDMGRSDTVNRLIYYGPLHLINKTHLS